MSDPHPVEPADAAEPSAPSPPAQPQPVSDAVQFRLLALVLAAALLVVIALVAAAPLWGPLLPWGAGAGAAQAERLDRVEPAVRQAQQEAADAKAALTRLERRIGALEARPAVPAGDLGELRDQAAKASSMAADLQSRVATLDQSLRAQATALADVAGRLAALDREVRAHDARGATDAALVLALLQVRAAVAVGRPFIAEYQALAALAREQPEIAAAAQPLAEPAKTGVASRAVLVERLRGLGSESAAPLSPAADDGWGAVVLARLSSLVTIRRVDGGPAAPDGIAAAVRAAETALAAGDLAAAVTAFDTLTGADREAAAPWLGMAKTRLAVDAALQRVEALATARLGAAPHSASAP
jgi:hypothetical protein